MTADHEQQSQLDARFAAATARAESDVRYNFEKPQLLMRVAIEHMDRWLDALDQALKQYGLDLEGTDLVNLRAMAQDLPHEIAELRRWIVLRETAHLD